MRLKSAAVAVVQSMGSLPVSSKESVVVELDALVAVSVNVGVTVSMMLKVLSRVSDACVSVVAAVARTTQLPVPVNVNVRVPDTTEHVVVVLETIE